MGWFAKNQKRGDLSRVLTAGLLLVRRGHRGGRWYRRKEQSWMQEEAGELLGSLSWTQIAFLFPGTYSLAITEHYASGWLSINLTPLSEAQNASWVIMGEKHHLCSGGIAHSVSDK